MQTSDTVFIQSPTGPLFIESDRDNDIHTSSNLEKKNHPRKEDQKPNLLITHDSQNYRNMKNRFSVLNKTVYKNVYEKLGTIKYATWRSVVVNPFGYWNKVHTWI